VPDDVATLLAAERKQLKAIAKETGDVTTWLHEREQSAQVAELYGADRV
jgi:hypothetical protein